MNSLSLGLVSLRAAALALLVSGNTRAAETLYALADAAAAGQAIDAHMAEVARLLEGRAVTDAEWQDVLGRIQTASETLQSVQPSG